MSDDRDHTAVPCDGPILSEWGNTVRIISGDERMAEAHRLRYSVFCEELGWVKGSNCGLEVDEFDMTAVHIGVYDGSGALVAYMRLVPPGNLFMVERDFSLLVGPGHAMRKGPDAAEVSRFCVSREARSAYAGCMPGQMCVSRLLIKGGYHWCLAHGVRFLYAVVEEKADRLYMMRHLPMTPVGAFTRMPDGTNVRAVLIDWRAFEGLNRQRRPALLDWFQSGSIRPSSEATAVA